MAIIIVKIIAVLVRTVAKPLITWVTYYNRIKIQENPEYKFIKNRMMWVGQMTNFYNIKLNRKLFKISPYDPIKKLAEDKALEKGAEFLSEILIYTILLSIPIFEWWRQSKINEIKNEMTQTGLKRLRIDIEVMEKDNERMRKELKILKDKINELSYKI
jgi:hypothetical protein